jgi:hypothetical protein
MEGEILNPICIEVRPEGSNAVAAAGQSAQSTPAIGQSTKRLLPLLLL